MRAIEAIRTKIREKRPEISGAIGDFLLENVHVSVHGKKKDIDAAKTHVKEGGSLLVVFNHFAKLDAIAYGKTIEKYIAPLDQLAAITSFRHIDPEGNIFQRSQGALIEDWHEVFGLSAIPVIQKKDIDDYEKKKKNPSQFNRRAIMNSVRFLKKAGHILGLSPEGTRSKVNRLLRAEDGLDLILKLGGEKVKVVTLAGEHSSIRPMNTLTNITIGEMFSYQDLVKDQAKYLEYYQPIWRSMGLSNPDSMPTITISDCAMARLAYDLPVENQGVYTQLVAIRRHFNH